jgi:hypothetical protein
LFFGSSNISTPATPEVAGATASTQDPLIATTAASPVMQVERMPTQRFIFPLLTKTANPRFRRARTIKPNKRLATSAARDSKPMPSYV